MALSTQADTTASAGADEEVIRRPAAGATSSSTTFTWTLLAPRSSSRAVTSPRSRSPSPAGRSPST
ncbi:MAG: hypothetical protein R2711_10445 [Acidimicrobiales bacterium]